MQTLIQDFRYGIRMLRKSPGLMVVGVITLALGIGANTAIFTVAKKVLFDTLPVKDPQQLRLLTWISSHDQKVPLVWGDASTTASGGIGSTSFSYPVFEELHKHSDVFQDLFAFKDIQMTATVDGHPDLIVKGKYAKDSVKAGEGVEIKTTRNKGGAVDTHGARDQWMCAFVYQVDTQTEPAQNRAATKFTEVYLGYVGLADFRKNARGELGTKTATLHKDGVLKLRGSWVYLPK